MIAHRSHDTIQPILVLLVWRGGDRFARCLESLSGSEQFFKRIIVSITSERDSIDVKTASDYVDMMAAEGSPSKIEVICTGRELPTMQHQAFWIDYLEATGAEDDDWIYWLAYDDQICKSGLARLLGSSLTWPLRQGTSYIGPWLLRHESANDLWSPTTAQQEEVWTSLPIEGPLSMPIFAWLRDQLLNPTYMQMSGSVTQLSQHKRLTRGRFPKQGPMRIEMATAAAPWVKTVEEFEHPISIIYGRSNSDRANYAGQSRAEDLHLLWTAKRILIRHPLGSMALMTQLLYQKLQRLGNQREEWRVRRISTY